MSLTRKRVAGAVLALALAGALSTGVASGVERLRGKARKRLAPPAPAFQGEAVRTRDIEDLARGRGPAPHPMTASAAPRRALSAPGPRARMPGETQRPAPWTERGAPAPSEPQPRPPDPGAAPNSMGHGAHGAGLTTRLPTPLRVGWTVVASSPGQVRLVADVERLAGFAAPVEVRLSLPAGVTLMEGAATFTVPAGAAEGGYSATYVVAFDTGRPPMDDLVLVARSEGAGFGVHAEARHVFGRALVMTPPQPVPRGPELPAALMTGAGRPRGAPDSDEEP
ncbi:hypothetical protein [Corallococcus macrosporus]|uniref:hypothetical protein n=1 Tax=Corallococcus macrosporus TaxID=35 RepID=UPI0003198819|nr:hypothetical protein [Corallococcus macrosporus]